MQTQRMAASCRARLLLLAGAPLAVGLHMPIPQAVIPPEAREESALDELWSGVDSLAGSGSHASFGDGRELPHSGPLVQLQILGSFDSGTTLMKRLLQVNMGEDTIRRACPDGDDSGHCYFWKHTPPELLEERVRKQLGFGNLLVLAMVRSPLALVQGLTKAPYNLRNCIRKVAWEKYEELPCTTTVPTKNPPEPLTQVVGHYSGIAGYWNSQTQAYHDLAARSSGIAGLQVMIIEYERLVIDTAAVLSEVAQAMGLQLNGPFQDLPGPSKTHGDAHGHAQALDDITNMRYLEKYPMSGNQTRERVCVHLKAELMSLHRVPVPGNPRAYSGDCQ